MSTSPRLDPRARRRHALRNAGQALLLLVALVGTLALVAWVVLGPTGLVWAAAIGVVALAARPRVPPEWVLSLYRARPLPARAAPQLHRVVAALAERAELPAVPRLHYVASPMLNAFAVGRPDDAALAVTDGLLRRLPARELVGVLAHEISHVRADDLWIMSLSDLLARATHALAYAGLLLLVFAVPATAEGGRTPLTVALLLTVVPTVVTLLQLALARSREYDADLGAATLTGDPEGLARALLELERSEGRLWERMMVPRRRSPDPFLLRTHPPTEERVRRLRALAPRPRRPLGGDEHLAPSGYPRVNRPVRLRPPGIRW